jgi:membrane associated rhomboid family serine protease
MRDLPPWLDRLLSALGVNTNRLRWKLHYLEEDLRRRRAAAGQPSHGREYKSCRHCGKLALADDRVCSCGHRLPSYAAYRVSRLVALETPHFAIVSFGFLALVFLLFAWQVLASGPGALWMPTPRTGLRFGAMNADFVNDGGQWWRLLTMALAHYGAIHLLFNGLALAQLLPRFEEEIGAWRALLLLTASQLGAGAACYWFSPHAATAGASGVVFGLIGFGLTYSSRLGRAAERSFYLHWLVYGVAFTLLVPNISWSGHFGGMAAGLAVGYLFGGRPPRKAARHVERIAALTCLAAWTVCVGFLIVYVARSG